MTSEWMASLPGKRIGAGVLLRDDAGRVLLVEPTYKDHWEVPGGLVEADESPYDAAVRELAEELALSRTPGRLLVVDWVPPRDGRTEGLMLIFDGGRLGAAETAGIVLPADELRSWAWSTPAQAAERLSPLLARRMAAARHAADSGTTAYMHDGGAVDVSVGESREVLQE